VRRARAVLSRRGNPKTARTPISSCSRVKANQRGVVGSAKSGSVTTWSKVYASTLGLTERVLPLFHQTADAVGAAQRSQGVNAGHEHDAGARDAKQVCGYFTQPFGDRSLPAAATECSLNPVESEHRKPGTSSRPRR